MGKTAPSCIVYTRTSTSGQKDAETIGAQDAVCKRLVKQHGLTPLPYGPKKDGWLVDDGISGRLLEGRVFSRLIDDIRAGKVRPDYVVVHSSSRLSRVDTFSADPAMQEQSAVDEARINSVLRGHQIKVLDSEGEHDDLRQESVENGREIAKIRRRTMDGKSRWLSEGRFARGGRPPYGYDQVPIIVGGKVQGFRLEVHAENAPRLRKVLSWFIEGGYAHAARKATAAGFPPSSATTKRKKAAGWTDSVRYMVLNAEVYLGQQRIEFGGETYVVKFPALIDAEFYARICRAQKEVTISKRTAFLSTGFVDCACGRHAFAHSSRGSHVITCRSRCGRVPEAVFSESLWTAVVCRLVEIAKHERAGHGTKDHFGSQLKAATARLTEIEERMGRLFDQYDARELPERVYKQRNAPLKDEYAMASAEVARITRERDAHTQKTTTEQSLASRIGAILEDLVLQGLPPLERRRELLGELLGGERVLVTWQQGAGAAELTMPKFRDLPVLKMRTDQIPSLVSVNDVSMYASLRMADFPAVAAKYARDEVPHPSASLGRGPAAVVQGEHTVTWPVTGRAVRHRSKSAGGRFSRRP